MIQRGARRRACVAGLLLFLAAGCNSLAVAFSPVVARSERIDIRSRSLDDETARAVLAAAEAVRGDLAREFGRDPERSITLMFAGEVRGARAGFLEIDPFGDCLVLHEDEGPALAKGGDRGLLRHEMGHFFIERLIPDAQNWYHEGLTEFLNCRRGWRTRDLADLPRLADELDADLVRAIAGSGIRYHEVEVPRPAAIVGGRFRPRRDEYVLARLIVAALHADGWPILERDPSGHILGNPERVAASIRSYARRRLWERALAELPFASFDPDTRAALAEALGAADPETAGSDAALRALVGDPEPRVRDRAALALFRRGDRRFERWVRALRDGYAARLAGGEIDEETARFACALAEALPPGVQ